MIVRSTTLASPLRSSTSIKSSIAVIITSNKYLLEVLSSTSLDFAPDLVSRTIRLPRDPALAQYQTVMPYVDDHMKISIVLRTSAIEVRVQLVAYVKTLLSTLVQHSTMGASLGLI